MAEKDPDNIRLAVLEEKLVNTAEVISKLDATIEKLSDLSVNVSKMLAVHEEKLEFARESAAETAREIDELEEKLNERMDDHSSRLRSVERRTWIGVGIAVAVTLLVQSPLIDIPFSDAGKPAIIERKQ